MAASEGAPAPQQPKAQQADKPKKYRVTVVARIKPTADEGQAAVARAGERSVSLARTSYGEASADAGEPRLFGFDRTFGPEATQEVMYAAFKPLVLGALNGENATVFAYGQTGSGKTHTMLGGGATATRDRGLIPRAISTVFKDQRVGGDVKVVVTFAEVYDDRLYDLLDQRHSGDPSEWPAVQVREDSRGALHFDGLSYYDADSEEAALHFLFLGTARRQVGASSRNDASSRSHLVFTIYLVRGGGHASGVGHPKAQQGVVSKLHLVDLAGSERFDVGGDGKVPYDGREARHINLSLHYLERVVVALHKDSSRRHVPYRDSVLTSMLRDSLGGSCQTAFIVTLSGDSAHLAETTATCRFGARCAQTTWAEPPPLEDGDDLARLERQVRDLKTALRARDAALAGAHRQGEALVRTVDELKRHVAEVRSASQRELAADEVQALVDGAAAVDGGAAIDGAAAGQLGAAAWRQLARALRDALREAVARPRAPTPQPSPGSAPGTPMSTRNSTPAGTPRDAAQEAAAASATALEEVRVASRQMLQRGAALLKHTRRGAPHARFVWLSGEGRDSKICWRKVGAVQPGESSVLLRDCGAVVRGGARGAGCEASITLRANDDTAGRPALTLQFDAGDSAATAVLRDEWLFALAEAIAAARPRS
ncbi:P-loop containing nucleoside triphosphate hydrolase protein [Pelagophyceae sp. CCMP2097]|nr:P-loop containing nucleoside triphosphate hydrolase protein [Pelagophyceae sp. CCMP2097]|mmetsp:Transcript_2865/g.8488  ORF Transcript_2865/g.8488 Transcript_2865/m.8488 type:complete len:656 (+) Transcript_2865:59-2026(+)